MTAKKVIWTCEVLVAILIAVSPAVIPAGMIDEEKIYNSGDYRTGQVILQFDIAEENDYRRTMELYFYKEDTHEICKIQISKENFMDEKKAAIRLPVGTYSLSMIEFDEEQDFDETAEMIPSVFSVTKDAETSGVLIQSGYAYTVPEEELLCIYVNDGNFDGYINLTLCDITDVTGGEENDDSELGSNVQTDHEIWLYHLSGPDVDGRVAGSVYAGNVYITEVCAYDKNEVPMDAYIPADFLTLCRGQSRRIPNFARMDIYVCSNLADLTEEQQKKINENGYVYVSKTEYSYKGDITESMAVGSEEADAFLWEDDRNERMENILATAVGNLLQEENDSEDRSDTFVTEQASADTEYDSVNEDTETMESEDMFKEEMDTEEKTKEWTAENAEGVNLRLLTMGICLGIILILVIFLGFNI